MPEECPLWVLHARKCLASEDIKHLEAALAACEDTEIGACLRRPQMSAGVLSHESWGKLVEELYAQGRRQEATALILLAVRGPALWADELARRDDVDERRRAFDHCVWLTDVSAKEGFADCEAYFAFKAGYLAESLPDESDRALDLVQRGARIFRKLAETQPGEYLGWLAMALNNLGGLYRRSARLEEARRAYRDALATYRDLGVLEAQAPHPRHVSALCNYGAVLRELHLYHTALGVYEEARAICGRLAAELPPSYPEEMARVHNNLGFLLFHMGRLAEAQEHYAKAMALREKLAAEDQRHAADLELTRENVAGLEEELRRLDQRSADPEWCLHVRRFVATSEVAHLDRAMETCTDPQSRALLEEMKAQPGSVTGEMFADWARSLKDQGRGIEAAVVHVLTARHGTFVLQALAGDPKEVDEDGANNAATCDYFIHLCHGHGFAECEAFFLRVKATYASRASDVTEVLDLSCQALRLYRMMSVREPDLWRHQTAVTLSDIAEALIARRKPGEACAAIREAIPLYEQLLAQDPSSSLRLFLLHAIAVEGHALTVQRQYSPALAVYAAAERDWRPLADEGDTSYRAEYADLLLEKGVLLAYTRQFAAAQEVFERAASSYDRLCEQDAPTYRGRRAGVLANWGNVLAERRLLQDAIQAYTRAAAIFDEFPEGQREIYLGAIGTVQNNLGSTYWELKSLEKAKTACEKAIGIRRRVASRDGLAFSGDVATSLMNLGLVCEDLGEYAAAEGHYAEALQIRRRLSGSSGADQDLSAAIILHNMAGLAERTGDTRRAREIAAEAVRTAEASSEDPRGLYLAKGKVVASYTRLLRQSLERNDADRTFRCLAAVREGAARLFDDGPETGLACALASLEAAAAKSARELSLILAEDLPDGEVLLAVMTSTSRGGFHLVRETCKSFRAKADELFAAVLAPFRSAEGGGGAVTWEETARLGREAWLALPAPVREALDPASGLEVLISGSPRWAAFPWEALRPGSGANDSLGLSRILARWSPLTGPALGGLAPKEAGGGNAHAGILNAWDAVASAELPHTRAECEKVMHLLSAQGFTVFPDESRLVGTGATATEFEEVLQHRPSLLHYSGHGGVIGNEEVLLLRGESAQGRPYGRKEMADLKAATGTSLPLLHWHPVVVLNACSMGRTRSFGGQREDLAWTLLQEGAAAVIASSFPVSDPMGRTFSEHLYTLACASRCLGEAFCRARAHVAEAWRDSPYHTLWSLFSYHGNPGTTLCLLRHGQAPGPGGK